jgi:phasin family protein
MFAVGSIEQSSALDKSSAAPHITIAAVQHKPALAGSSQTKGVSNMVRKSSTKAGERSAETLETAMKNGSEAFKAGFEKAVKGYDQFWDYGRDTVEAYVKAANVAGKGAETIQNEIYAYSKQSVEDSITAAKAMFGSRSVHEAFEVQTDFVKSAFESYVSEMTKLSEIMFSTTKEALNPLQGRVQAWAEVVENSRAA